ncbi:hypothetical protein [Micromonospora inaquosa]|uniref:hypothetical protein n=1 Tax=Micromonospora inaquosa TaxID=2203716 RepID=UPI000F5FE7A6|nr:hypothetical protein [Micromonospora inaquosa]
MDPAATDQLRRYVTEWLNVRHLDSVIRFVVRAAKPAPHFGFAMAGSAAANMLTFIWLARGRPQPPAAVPNPTGGSSPCSWMVEGLGEEPFDLGHGQWGQSGLGTVEAGR